jgi:D-alanine-D-alanine ligase
MKIKVGVFIGGKSVEHEVSIVTGLQVVHALDKEKYEAIPIYVTKTGLMYSGQDLFEVDNYKDTKKLLQNCQQVFIINNGNEHVIVKYPGSMFGSNIVSSIDVAFLALHGTNGEDGTFQGYLNSIGLPYTGCDILSSAIGMDKIITKKVLKESGIPVLDYLWFNSSQWNYDNEKIINEVEKEIGYPVIVKPANTGSSVGISGANNREELIDAAETAAKYSERILFEEMVVNIKEINCSVLGDYESAEASVCEEPVSSKDILT